MCTFVASCRKALYIIVGFASGLTFGCLPSLIIHVVTTVWLQISLISVHKDGLRLFISMESCACVLIIMLPGCSLHDMDEHMTFLSK